MKQIVLSGIVFIVSYLLTLGAKIISARRNLHDVPNSRSLHYLPTPRIGGIAIVITWYAGITIMFIYGKVSHNLYFALLSGAVLAIVSLIDDIFTIRPIFRLAVQIATAGLAIWFINGIRPVDLFGTTIIDGFLLYPLFVAGVVWFINVYNFLDGIDGYAAIEAVCVSVAMLLITGDFINVVLIASVLGFLIWNWPKARIFMGDVGSTQLGFILVILGIWYNNSNSLSIFWWLILTAPFWFDATLTLIRRIVNRETLSEAHSKHAYQRLVQSGFSHMQVDWILIGINVVLISLVYAFIGNEWMKIVLLLIEVVMLYSMTRYIDRRKPFRSG